MCYQGSLLGSLEMTRTVTTCFVDMYFHMEDVARAVDEAGLRAILSPGMIDKPDKAGTEHERRTTLKFLEYIRSEEHTSELQSQFHLVCRLLLEKKKKSKQHATTTTSY